jgi:hypothetical protein
MTMLTMSTLLIDGLELPYWLFRGRFLFFENASSVLRLLPKKRLFWVTNAPCAHLGSPFCSFAGSSSPWGGSLKLVSLLVGDKTTTVPSLHSGSPFSALMRPARRSWADNFTRSSKDLDAIRSSEFLLSRTWDERLETVLGLSRCVIAP